MSCRISTRICCPWWAPPDRNGRGRKGARPRGVLSRQPYQYRFVRELWTSARGAGLTSARKDVGDVPVLLRSNRPAFCAGRDPGGWNAAGT